MQSKFIVLSDPVQGKEQAYNDWYDQQHLHDMLTIAGVISAQRFAFVCKINDVPHWRYCALYTIEGDDPAAVIENLLKNVASGAIYVSDSMDQHTYAAAYEPIGEEIRR
jgi:hypothetical protein